MDRTGLGGEGGEAKLATTDGVVTIQDISNKLVDEMTLSGYIKESEYLSFQDKLHQFCLLGSHLSLKYISLGGV